LEILGQVSLYFFLSDLKIKKFFFIIIILFEEVRGLPSFFFFLWRTHIKDKEEKINQQEGSGDKIRILKPTLSPIIPLKN